MIFVTKADGTREPFQKGKIINTCMRMHAGKEAAEIIAEKIESRVYDGVPTYKILRMIFIYLKKYRPAIRQQIDLRKAISLLRPKPDFELFVDLLLREYGYQVTPNQIVQGRCIEHEIDAIAQKNDETLMVEVKHHLNHHTYTSLDVCKETWATFEDLTEGFKLGLNSIKFTKALIVCNTKFSEHARRYAKCRGIEHIGWKAPPEGGLEQKIEEKKLYPITLIKGLGKETEGKLGDNGIVLLKQLTEYDIDELSQRVDVKKDRLRPLIEKASEILLE